MRASRAFLLAIFACAVVLAGACGGSKSCAQGTERCSCYGNGTCNSGLTCASNTCVNLAGAGGTSGAAGTSTGTGGSSSAGAGGTSGAAGTGTGTGGSSSAGTGGTATGGTGGTGPACPVGCCAAPNPGMGGATTLADSVVGFSDTQNKCGWSYGYLPNGAEPFTLLSVFTGISWEEATSRPPWTVIFVDRQHSTDVPAHWSDRRWTSPGAGTISIRGHFAKTDPCCGDGTIGRIRVGGSEIWSADVAFNDTTGVDFALSATVSVGTTVDFILDPKSNNSADTTAFTAVITK